MTIGDALARFRILSDTIDDLNAKLKTINAEWDGLEKFIVEQAEAQGINSFSNDSVTVGVASAFRVGYDPAEWEGIVRWAVESGNFAAIQRRLGDKCLLDLLDSGGEIPKGVRFDPIKKVSVRRK